jgi:lipopolysaccharide transport system permease protein
MWATPIVYPLSLVPEKYRLAFTLNPMTPIVEIFRFAFTGAGSLPIAQYFMSVAVTAMLLVVGMILFHRTEQTFIDVA